MDLVVDILTNQIVRNKNRLEKKMKAKGLPAFLEELEPLAPADGEPEYW